MASAQYKDTIVIKYEVGMLEYYSIDDKEWIGTREVIVVLNKTNCHLVGGPVDLGATN